MPKDHWWFQLPGSLTFNVLPYDDHLHLMLFHLTIDIPCHLRHVEPLFGGCHAKIASWLKLLSVLPITSRRERSRLCRTWQLDIPRVNFRCRCVFSRYAHCFCQHYGPIGSCFTSFFPPILWVGVTGFDSQLFWLIGLLFKLDHAK